MSSGSLGPSGVQQVLVIVPVFKDEDEGKHQIRLHDRTERRFMINARLSKSTDQPKNIDCSVNKDAGSSYILAQHGANFLNIQTPEGVCQVELNQARELSNIKLEITASTATEARSKFSAAVAPFLDHISFLADTPIYVSQISVDDTANQVQHLSVLIPNRSYTLNGGVGEFDNRIKPLFAMYREAKISNSPFYKFLCFYKILEAIYTKLRPDVFKSAREKGISLDDSGEVVPEHQEIRSRTPELVGRAIQQTYQERVTVDYRDRIAHGILSDGSMLNVSDFETFSNFADEVFLIAACARVAMESLERYYRQA